MYATTSDKINPSTEVGAILLADPATGVAADEGVLPPLESVGLLALDVEIPVVFWFEPCIR
jgi:hypothetical protein